MQFIYRDTGIREELIPWPSQHFSAAHATVLRMCIMKKGNKSFVKQRKGETFLNLESPVIKSMSLHKRDLL